MEGAALYMPGRFGPPKIWGTTARVPPIDG